MRGRIKDLLIGRGQKQVLMLELDEDFRANFDELNGSDVEVTVKRWRPKRSLDANAYCWVLIDKLSEKLGIEKAEIYRDAIRQIGGVSDMVCVRETAFDALKRVWESRGLGWQVERMPSKLPNCVNAVLYSGSSEYDSTQMARLISIVQQSCEEQGIPTMTDEEISTLIGKWAVKEDKNG